MATKLYPPIIEETLPAFYKQNDNYIIKIPFMMNKTVSYNIISGFALTLRNILGGKYIFTNKYVETPIYNRETSEVIFSIPSSELQNPIYEGSFYKAQIAYQAKDKTVGYYSTVGIIKCVARPTVFIENLDVGNVNVFTNDYIGKYVQNSAIGDTSEKVYSYEFNIYDNHYNLFATSGIQVHNTSMDEAENYSIDTFHLYKTINKYETYYIQYNITTVNKLTLSSPLYHITAIDTLDMANALNIQATNITDDGYILISFIEKLHENNEQLLKTIFGDNFNTFYSIYNKFLNTQIPYLKLDDSIFDTAFFTQLTEQVRLGKITINTLSNILLDLGFSVITNTVTLPTGDANNFLTTYIYKDPLTQQQYIIDRTTKHTSSGNTSFKIIVNCQYIGPGYPGMYIISKSADNGITWEEVQQFVVGLNDTPHISTHFIKDYFIEQGKTYIYSIQEFNRHGVTTNRILSKPVYADYEDMYLQDKDRVLKIRFNPKVSSFKIDIPEQKTETIGSKYPYFFRNGQVYYHEFPIAGLLSFQLDTALEFLTPEEQIESGILELIDHRKYSQQFATQHSLIKVHEKRKKSNSIVIDDNKNYSLTSEELARIYNHKDKDLKITRHSTDLIDINMYTERYFKLKVLEWLNNGRPKLFKSATEGLYIVRLLNISLTPEDKLGRMIHSFNSTAYEVADINLQNAIKLQLIPEFSMADFLQIYHPEELISLSKTVPAIFSKDGSSLLTFLGSYIKELHFTDCSPKDCITISYSDGTTSTFYIGASGEFHITEEERTILDVIFKANGPDTHMRYFERVYADTVNTSFDNYTRVFSMAIPCLGLSYSNNTRVYDETLWSSNNGTWTATVNNVPTSCEPAVFDASYFGTQITNANALKHYLGYSFYIDKAHTKPKILLKHIDQIIITKRQIVNVYKNPTADQYLVNVFGKGFLNDRSLVQQKQINSDKKEHILFDDNHLTINENSLLTRDLTFTELTQKTNSDVFSFQGLMDNFKNDRFTILHIYNYTAHHWTASNNYYIPAEDINSFVLTNDDWKYKLNNQEFIAIPNEFREDDFINSPNGKEIQDYINTSTYVKVIDVDRLTTFIPHIYAGRGVCVDIVPQFIIYDYLFEDTDATLHTAKNTYLNNKTLNNLYNYLRRFKGK